MMAHDLPRKHERLMPKELIMRPDYCSLTSNRSGHPLLYSFWRPKCLFIGQKIADTALINSEIPALHQTLWKSVVLIL